MGVARVKAHLRTWGKDGAVREFATSSATVSLAAAVLGVEPARIAKTLAFRVGDGVALVVFAGDVRVDNAKLKKHFRARKIRMLDADETLAATGHAVGGVCPFALPEPAPPVWLDASLARFATVFAGAGAANAMIELAPDELFACAGAAGWVDVAREK